MAILAALNYLKQDRVASGDQTAKVVEQHTTAAGPGFGLARSPAPWDPNQCVVFHRSSSLPFRKSKYVKYDVGYSSVLDGIF